VTGLDHSTLVVAATVGTAHRAVDVAALPEAIRPDPLPAESAVAVLDAAALSALARRTVPATPPGPASAPVTPAPERLPPVPDVVRQVLGRVHQQPEILIEALSLVHRAGMRLPPVLLPGLLDDPRPAVVTATRPIGGEIGRLLMTKNPRWAPPAEPDPADRSLWDEGTVVERTAWLRVLRRTDPAAARDLLADGFDRENSAARAELLAVLADGLSPADQDFLLATTADRSRAVVARSLDLLTRLPASPLRRSMRTLAARHLVVGRRFLRTTITVTDPTPAEFAPWPVPDGDPWTTLLARIDPAEWPQIFGTDLLALVAAGPEELQPLGPGLRQAALTFRDAALARVLVYGRLAAATAKAPPTVDPPLWAVLTPADATDLLDRLLADRRARPDQVAAAVTAVPRPWPLPFARRLAAWLPAVGNTAAPAPRQLWDQWAAAAALPDCRNLAELARTIAARATGDQAAALITRAGNAANLLTLRAVLHETLCRSGGNQ
jgi:hypothetical protein